MKKLAIAAVIAGCVGTSMAAAAAEGGQAVDRPYYWGVTGGIMFPSGSNTSSALNAGGLFGANIRQVPGLAVEAQGTTTLSDGKVSGLDFSVDTLAAYAVWRSPGQVYFKGRAGLLWEHVDVGAGSASDNGASVGAGVGFRLHNGQSVEIEYTVIESDINMLSVNYNF